MPDTYVLSWNVKTDQEEKQGTETIDFDSHALHIYADLKEGIIEKIEARMTYTIDDYEKIFMNGYQSWTTSRELSKHEKLHNIERVPDPLIKRYAFDRYGDYHFVKYGEKDGQSHGFSYCYFRNGKKYHLIGSLNERNGYTIIRYDADTNTLSFEKDMQGVKHEGGELKLFDLFFMEGKEEDVFDAWFDAMHIKPRQTEPLCGYSSWYNRYQDINEQAINDDLEAFKPILKEGDLFQIDDGWEPFVGDWLKEDENKFPNGLKPLVEKIHACGYQAGLWLSPFVCETNSDIYKEHPEWLLKVDGEAWCLGCNWSSFYSLDIDNPEVIQYVRDVFHKVFDEWGFDLVKLDFLYGAAPFGNEKESRSARMYRAMELLRECCKDKRILGCGVPLYPSFGLVDYCRIGCDVGLDWNDHLYMQQFHNERVSTENSLTNTIFRRQLNNRAFQSDPDVYFLREDNVRLSRKQKEQLAIADVLLGGVMLTSDVPSSYSDEAKQEYQRLRYIHENARDVHVDIHEDIRIYYTVDQKIHYAVIDAFAIKEDIKRLRGRRKERIKRFSRR